MELLHALGINQLAFVQFLIFVAMFVYLTQSVFGPFVAAAEERQKRTKGGEALAEEYAHKTVDLQSKYQDKARELNSHIHAIFQQKRGEAVAESDRILGQARQEANALVEKNRQALEIAVRSADGELRSQTGAVALSITNKLLGK